MAEFINDLKDRDLVRYMLLRSIKDENQRKHIATLLEFDSEISRIPFLINDGMMGYIRTAWWRDNLLNGNIHISYTENTLLYRAQGLVQYNRNNAETVKAFTDLISSIELIIERRKFDYPEEFIEAYIDPVGTAYAILICSILRIPVDEHIVTLFRSYAIIAFVRSYDLLVDFGWEIFDLPHPKLITLLNKSLNNIKKLDKQVLKHKPFRVIYTATEFFADYYLKNIPSKEASLYEPNLGLLKMKLAWQILF
ncbi:MAG: hypothetical protein K0Q51_1412 [Rickettsiaceae bacterium]|jgi:hypothetical protein|nr:hypothetical protein [Rickettsiaceae bacterium]